MSVKSKHSSKRSSGSKKEKKKKIEDSDEDFESSEEELDLTKECHPIGYYLNNRAEMINQMFSVIKGNKLKAMLPPILKDCDLEQLKLQCLDQLLGMSDKRITCILEGESLDTSSESEVIESDEGDSEEKNGTTSGSNLDRSDYSEEEYHANHMDRKHKKRKVESNIEGKAGKIPKTGSEPPEQGKTLLEILELEMRARAIRALLKQSGNEKGSDQGAMESKADGNKSKETSGEIVDLTECDDEFPVCVKKEKADEEDIDKKVLSFEKKIEKSKTEKQNQQDEKAKKLQAELEIRNKLFKKKIYRTRQQRMENEEEEKNPKNDENEEKNLNENDVEVKIKEEPIEPEEVVVEDPEEGEISTSDDEYPVEIKQEPVEQEEEPKSEDFVSKIDKDAERVTAIDNGIFVTQSNVENNLDITSNNEEEKQSLSERNEDEIPTENKNHVQETESQLQSIEQEPESSIEETSWRDRWLQKDGVQKLVKSSKIYAKVKKRIAEKTQKAKEEIPTSNEANSDSNSNPRLEMIEGSIEEYERLLGKNGNSQPSASDETVNKITENSKAEKT